MTARIRVTAANLRAAGIYNTYDILRRFDTDGDVVVSHVSAEKWVIPGWAVWSKAVDRSGSIEHKSFITSRDTKEAQRVAAIAWANEHTGRPADTAWARDPFGGWHPTYRLANLAEWLNTDDAETRRQEVTARLAKHQADRAAEEARWAERRNKIQKGTG